MRISDWSSDVCSSDLLRPDLHPCLLCRLPPSRRPREGVGEAPGRRQGRRDASGGPVMTRSILLAATGALALSACTVGPAYHSPAPAAPSQAPFVEGGKSPVFTGDQPPGEWWSLFGDPTLDALVRQALAANTDLDRKSTRLNSVTNAHLVCRLLLEKNNKSILPTPKD